MPLNSGSNQIGHIKIFGYKKTRRGEHESRRVFQSDLAGLSLIPPPEYHKASFSHEAAFIHLQS